MNKKIIIISGDPNSINSELIIKSFKKIKKNVRKKIYIISNYNLLKKQFKKLRYKIKILKVSDILDKENNCDMKLINIDLKFKDPFKIAQKEKSHFLIKSLNLAHKIALKNKVIGIINCPINKNLLIKPKTGITEYFARKCNIKDNSEVMLINNKEVSVSPITTHLDLKEVPKKISKQLIINKVKTINTNFIKLYKRKPKICILGLNPHNAELRKNSEEVKIIIPSISILKKLKINIAGPFVADTVFIEEFKKFDVIVGMYHDQVLAPFKSIYKFDAINITLGLKYLRLSPDHGVAVNLIGKNKANISSLLNCIDFLNKR